MVQVTPEAARHLSAARDQRGLSRKAGVRFLPSGSGVGLTFSVEPEPGDTVLITPEIPVYLAPEVARRLDGSMIDVGERDGKVKLYARPSQAPAKTSQRQRTEP